MKIMFSAEKQGKNNAPLQGGKPCKPPIQKENQLNLFPICSVVHPAGSNGVAYQRHLQDGTPGPIGRKNLKPYSEIPLTGPNRLTQFSITGFCKSLPR